MKKKIIAVLLACMLAVGMTVSPVGTETVWAEDDDYVGPGKTEDGFRYREYGEYIEIWRYEGTATEIEIPDVINSKPVTEIGNNAFAGCSGLTSIKIPQSVTTIINDAFEDCSGLTSIEIPQSVTTICRPAFKGCNRLKEILVAENNPHYVSKDGILYDTDDGLALVAYPAGKDNTEVSIPEGVTAICDEAFFGCSKLISIKIPQSVTKIGNWIDDTLPSGEKMKQVNNPFVGCSQLKDILVDGNNFSYKDGMLCKDGVLISYAEGRDNTQVSIPKGVTTIGVNAFSGCSKLTNVSIPSGVKWIGGFAFEECSGLNSIIIPEGVTYIGLAAFEKCSGLNSVIIPESVTGIGMSAFPANLKDVYYAGNEEQFSKIIHPVEKKFWESRNIQYNFVIPTDSTDSGDVTPPTDSSDVTPPTDSGDVTSPTDSSDVTPPTDSTGKTDQTITAKDITKTYGAKAFSLNAKADTGTALTYVSSNKKVATVDTKGKVTIRGCGVTDITITAPETEKYNQAQKSIKLTVKPKKVALSTVKSTKKKTAAVKWKRDKKVSGYLIQCATDKKFKKNKVQVTVNKNKTVSATVKKLKPGKKYYVRVCAYAKSGKTKVQGDWSKAKTVKVKR